MTAPYSSLRHLAWSLWGKHDPAECLMAMFTGYYDSTGKHHDPDRIVVAGFISSEKKWLRFEEQWTELLLKYDIPQPFHATDYAAAKSGAYRQFDGDDDLREKFEKRALKIIRKNTHLPVSVGIMLPHYREAMAEYDIPVDQQINGHTFAAMVAALWSLRWAYKHEAPEIELIYEHEEKIGEFYNEFERHMKRLPVVRKKKQHPAEFAAADIVAWRHGRDMRQAMAGRSADGRPFFGDFTRLMPQHLCRYLNKTALQKRFEKLGFTRLGSSAV